MSNAFVTPGERSCNLGIYASSWITLFKNAS